MLFMGLSIEWIFDQVIANTLDLVEVVDGKIVSGRGVSLVLDLVLLCL